MRIKVQVGEDKGVTPTNSKTNAFRKFVYVIKSPSNKSIDELLQDLQEYIAQTFSFTKTRLVQLMTDDGYILSKTDQCLDVLKENDRLIAIDMQRFIENYNSHVRDVQIWAEFRQHDASDNRERFIRIGLNNFSELFVRMFGCTGSYALYVFGIHELITIAKEKRQDNLIARLDQTSDYDRLSNADWFIETRWEYDSNSNKDLFIICNLKVASNDDVCSNKIHVILDLLQMRIEHGEITRLSGEISDGPLNDQQRQRLKELTSKLPPMKRTGPQINVNMNEIPKLSKYECEGESSIRMACGNTNVVHTFQDRHMSDDGTFGQNFVITHIIFSKKPLVLPEILQQKRAAPVDKPVSITSLTMFYQSHDGAWRACEDVAIAPIAMRNEEPNWLTDAVINIEPDKLVSFTIKGSIIVKGEPGGCEEARARAHKTLPQPLKLKIVIIDNFGKQCSLILEYINSSLELTTRESFLRSNQSSILEILAFVYADDCETDERVCMSMFINQDHRLVLKTHHKSFMSYDRKALRLLEYNAKQNKSKELPLPQASYERYTQSNKAFALFDLETSMLYAIRLEVSTKTSKTEETVLVPLEKIK